MFEDDLEKHVSVFAGFIGEQFNLMHNNARPHAAVIVRNFLQAVGIEAVEWSSRSPDLNPIEHLWDIPGRQIRQRRRQVLTLQDLRAALQEDWENLPQEAIQNLFQSMPRRLATVIRARH
ncbi:Transposable element Tcb1 transposase-like Protein [Tribolium castaneum]|uniref:Transposable element Tcb1 transposase-like Protein n=1 Tax=Tribolium castaneum TaxID=7070 RepID=D7ELV0_TRICA|nr:Transposable element Tcb1 transposase-like Protein [Tribolium castaneum]